MCSWIKKISGISFALILECVNFSLILECIQRDRNIANTFGFSLFPIFSCSSRLLLWKSLSLRIFVLLLQFTFQTFFYLSNSPSDACSLSQSSFFIISMIHSFLLNHLHTLHLSILHYPLVISAPVFPVDFFSFSLLILFTALSFCHRGLCSLFFLRSLALLR